MYDGLDDSFADAAGVMVTPVYKAATSRLQTANGFKVSTGLFTTNDVRVITQLFLNETEIFNFYKYLMDRHSQYGYLGAETLMPVWHSRACK